jgi:hypothetical protein
MPCSLFHPLFCFTDFQFLDFYVGNLEAERVEEAENGRAEKIFRVGRQLLK